MKTKPQESSPFQELWIFENSEINASLDAIYNLLERNFGTAGENIMVCGSVAKMLDGKLAENYQPKDIDLVVFSPKFWRFLQANIHKVCANVVKMDYRLILSYPNHLIEIWIPQHNNAVKGIFKNKIHYCYGH